MICSGCGGQFSTGMHILADLTVQRPDTRRTQGLYCLECTPDAASDIVAIHDCIAQVAIRLIDGKPHPDVLRVLVGLMGMHLS